MIGIIGKKCGMTRVFMDDGKSVPVTIVQANPNQINRIKTFESDGYNAIQVSANKTSLKITKPQQGQFKKSNITPRVTLHEFRIDSHEAEQVEPGKEITVNYFNKGELVDVVGKTIGKGYAGVIKRHNFSMQDATHGNSLAHRAPGSIGQNQTPGRVFKGKKMSGHMGDVRRTVQNLEIIEIDEERNLLFIKGSVSGHVNSDLIVTPATKSKKIDREIFVTLDHSSEEAQPETPETSSEEVQPETPETSSEEAQPETPETSSEEAQPEIPEERPETEEEKSINSDQENIEKV
jgi:large subunit ribosomal protein L3